MKFSFKKALAVTLAAATALTFAPVGLLETGVVAEAAQAKGTISADSTVTAGGKIKIGTLSVGSTDANDKFTVGFSAKAVKAGDTPTASTDFIIAAGTAAGNQTDPAYTVTAGNASEATFTVTDASATTVNLLDSVTDGTTNGNLYFTAPLASKDYYLYLAEKDGGSGDAKVLAVQKVTVVAETSISVNSSANCTVKPAKTSAVAGETVTFTVTPDAYATVTSVVVKGSDNKEIATTVSGETYSFVVPAGLTGITIDATAIKGTAPSPTITATGDLYNDVLGNVVFTDNTSYDLVNGATVVYKGVTYPASGLNWYIVDSSVSAGDSQTSFSNIKLTTDSFATISSGAGNLTVTVKNTKDAAKNTANELNGKHIIATVTDNNQQTVVYAKSLSARYADGKTVEINATAASDGKTAGNVSTDLLDSVQVADPDNNRDYITANKFNALTTANTSVVGTVVDGQVTNETNFALTLGSSATGTDTNVFKGSSLALKAGKSLESGSYAETVFVPFKIGSSNVVNVAKINIKVSVNYGPKAEISDGATIYDSTINPSSVSKDNTLYLDLKQNTTFDIAAHLKSNVDGTTYKYVPSSANVSVDEKGVVTAKHVGTCVITVTPTANGIAGTALKLKVQVNANGRDVVIAQSQDKTQTATVLNNKQYNNANDAQRAHGLINSERDLAAAQIKYIQINVTGNETTAVSTTPYVVSTGGAVLAFSLVDEKQAEKYGASIDRNTGKITISAADNNIKTILKDGPIFAVKVVSGATANSAVTTSYYYFVVDKADEAISGLESAYTVGSKTSENNWCAIDFVHEVKHPYSKATYYVLGTYDEIAGDTYYDADSQGSYVKELQGTTCASNNDTVSQIWRATATGKTMHILAAFENKDGGRQYKLITLTSAEGKTDKIASVVNTKTGEVYYKDGDEGTAKILPIDATTQLTVTLTYPVESNGTYFGIYSYNPEKSYKNGSSDGTVINQFDYVTAVKDNKVNVTLYPNKQGTQVIFFYPEGDISATDRTIIDNKATNLAVTYRTTSVTKPSKVTGVKVSNKKGAKVTVKFNKVNTAPTIRYYVQKKIGKKVSGKSIGSTKTTLSVKKGATVKVRVKAYFYDANGKKHVGAYSAWKTLKTDKK